MRRTERSPIRQAAIEEMVTAGCTIDQMHAVECAWMICWAKLEGKNEITAYANEEDEEPVTVVLA